MDNLWKQILDEISSPWDVAATAGGGAEAIITIALGGGSDLGSSAAEGALAAATQKKKLIKSMNELISQLTNKIEVLSNEASEKKLKI